MKIIRAVFKGSDYIASGLSWIAFIGIIALVLITFADVTGRYFFNLPLHGSLELTEVSMATLGGFAILWTTSQGGHIIIDVVTSKFSKRAQILIDIIGSLLGCGIWAVIAYRVFNLGIELSKMRQSTPLIQIPVAPFQLILATAFLLNSLVLFIQAFRPLTLEKKGGGAAI